MKIRLLSVSLFVGILSNSEAGTATFPEKDPAFTVTYPDDWTVKVDSEGNLNFKASARSGPSFLIQKLDAKTEEEVTVFLQRIVKSLDLGDAKTAKVSEIKETTTPKGVKLLAITSTNTAMGFEMIYSDTAFAPKKGVYFGLLNVGFAADLKAHEKEITEVLNSITPISGNDAD